LGDSCGRGWKLHHDFHHVKTGYYELEMGSYKPLIPPSRDRLTRIGRIAQINFIFKF